MLVAVNIDFGYPSSLVRYISPEFNLPIMRRGRVKEFSKLKKKWNVWSGDVLNLI
jgi:hypothetical protein